MDFYITWEKLLRALKRMFRVWFAVAAAVVLFTLAAQTAGMVSTKEVAASVNYSYDGIERGSDPMGNRFDPLELLDESVMTEAAEKAGLDSGAEAVALLRDEMSVTGILPNGVVRTVSAYRSIFSDGSVLSTSEVRSESYYPSQYVIRLRYAAAGLTKQQGIGFLEALLEAYETFFYDLYGYNPTIVRSLQAIDYSTYDYDNAVEVLDQNLLSLQQYVQRLASSDYTRFRSDTTGYTFSDLEQAIATLRTEDIYWISSNVEINNVTRDRQELVNYYEYKIENAARNRDAKQEYLAALNNMLENYQKTNALIFGITGGGTEGAEGSAYEIAQQSETYDALMNEKIETQTDISEIQEQIRFYQTRVDRLNAAEQTGDAEAVEERLAMLSEQVKSISGDIERTASEYFETVRLKRAFQVVSEPQSVFSLRSLLSGTVKSALPAEFTLFGIYTGLAVVLAAVPEERQRGWYRAFREKFRDGKRGQHRSPVLADESR